MPRVPTYDEPRLQQAPLRGGENTTRAIDMGAGSTMLAAGKAVSALGDVGDRIQERRDLDAAFRVETKVLSDFIDFEQNLRKTRRGASAVGVVDDVDKWWSKLDETHGKDVSPRVKELTAKSLARARAQSLASIGRYQAAEEDRAQTESYTAVNGTEIQRAVTAGTPEALAGAKGKIEAAVSVFGATRGWTPEQVTAEKQKWSNILHTQAVGNLVDSNPQLAKQYFEANRSEIDSANHARFTKLIDRAVAEDKATKSAAEWAALPFEKAIENANKITDPDERKLTIAAVRDLQTDKNIAIQLREREASDKVWQAVANGATMKALPKALLEQMNGRERMQVNEHFEAERKRRAAEAAGKPVKTDMAVFEKLISMPPEELARTQLSVYQDKVSRGDLEQLMVRKANLMHKDPKVQAEAVSMEQQIGTYVTTMKLKDEAKGMFMQAAHQAVIAHQKATGKEPDYETRQKIFDRLSIEKAVDGGWFGSDKRFFEATPDEQAAFVNKTIPQLDRQQIKEALAAQNRPFTMMNVMDMWERMQVKKRQEAAAKGQK